MPRASRIYAPGQGFHITHRCHKREFSLKFKQDRERYRYWLYEARKRYGFCVLNYIITSNHIHLLVMSTTEDIIPSAMQLVAGRTAQEYNLRKKRGLLGG
ncbi:TPA: transposase [Legionella anisa]|uniref:transposase n=1 Tax=Legionella anisa TaxID=28082 RepID=UPI00192ACD8D|nr:transposase [Legionella anisa]